MTRVIKAIDVPGSYKFQDRTYMRIMFVFEDHPSETIGVEQNQWLKILEGAKAHSATVSWNELKKQIYYSVVMGIHEKTYLTTDS